MRYSLLHSFHGRLLFFGWWGFIILIHTLVVKFAFDIGLLEAIIDSIVANLILALISVGLWYWVKAADLDSGRLATTLVNLLAVGAVSTAIYTFLSAHLLSLLFSHNQYYVEFIKDFIAQRAVAGGFIYALLVLFFYLAIYVQSFREKLEREAELNSLVKEAELNWLKLQVNPHFLFNSLNSVSSLTITSPPKAQEMIIRLSELLRYSLNLSPSSMVPLEREIDCCIKYLDIERVRFGSRLSYSIDNEPSCNQIEVPGMIIQPLFENAIKHGVAQFAQECHVDAKVRRVTRGLEISVTNNLCDDPFNTPSTGVGLENIRRRLQLIYGSSHLLKIDRTEEQFTATLTIPS